MRHFATMLTVVSISIYYRKLSYKSYKKQTPVCDRCDHVTMFVVKQLFTESIDPLTFCFE